MKSTLVTGASGFVGSFLMKELQRHDIPTIGVSRTEKAGLLNIPSYGEEMNWAPILEKVDTVVHLAARVHVMKDRASDPLSEFRRANVDATLHLARAAIAASVRRFIFVSTIKVNGETTRPGQPFRSDDPHKPEGPYAVSKAEAEIALLGLGRQTDLEVVILRPTLVYGPGAKGNLAALKKWAHFQLPSPFGAIHNRRSLVHLSNLSSAIMAARREPRAADQVFLIADGTHISTHELLLDLGWKRPPRILEVDVEKARTLLNWDPLPFVSQSTSRPSHD